MAMFSTGTIYIPLEDFWEFAAQYAPLDGVETAYGRPRATGSDIEIDFVASTAGDPRSTDAGKAVLEQWEESRLTARTVLRGRSLADAIANELNAGLDPDEM